MIRREEVLDVQMRWREHIMDLRNHREDRTYCERKAKELVNRLYNYGRSDVLFKPTLAALRPFRPSVRGAISYFIGRDEHYPEDRGFALALMSSILMENHQILTSSDYALAMGHYHFTMDDGSVVMAEYSFGYVRDEAGELRIQLHHSSMPFAGLSGGDDL